MRTSKPFQFLFLTATCTPLSAVIAGILWHEEHPAIALLALVGITAMFMALSAKVSHGVTGFTVRRIVHDDIIFTPVHLKLGVIALAGAVGWWFRTNPYWLIAATSLIIEVVQSWIIETEIVRSLRAFGADAEPRGFSARLAMMVKRGKIREAARYSVREGLHFLGLLSLSAEMERFEETFMETAILAPYERERAIAAIRNIQTALGLDILTITEGHRRTLDAIAAFSAAAPEYASTVADMATVLTGDTPKE